VKKEDNSSNLKDIYSQEAIKPDEEELEYGANAADIASDRMAANLADNYIHKDPDEISPEEDKEPGSPSGDRLVDGQSDDDEYEILTYRKKEYWIKKGEDPHYVYEVLEDDALGEKIGMYKKGVNGKMKVVLDKK